MHYVLFNYGDPAVFGQLSQEELGKLYRDIAEFEAEITQSGAKLGNIRVQPAHTAKAIRVRAGKPLTTDGPFAEMKEQIGGLYIINAKDDAEAEKIASRFPGARYGMTELRRIQMIDIPGKMLEKYDYSWS